MKLSSQNWQRYFKKNLGFSLLAISSLISSALWANTYTPEQALSMTLGTSRNSPAYFSNRRFKGGGGLHPKVGLRYRLSENWFTGISSNFKFFQDNSFEGHVPIFSLSQEFDYLIPIYRPLYLLLGYRTIYLLPTRIANFPLQRNPDHELEIGFGATLGLWAQTGKKIGLGCEINRWRGTKTNKFHGFEVSLYLSHTL